MKQPKIDAHHHLWLYKPEEYGWIDESMSAIRRDFIPRDLQASLPEAGVDGTIAVQARQTLEETQWLLNLAEQHSFMRGVVGWAPISADSFPECLDRLKANKKLKGLRHVIQGEPDDGYILREDFNRGIRSLQGSGLTYDILILDRQLPHTITFVDQHPNQVFVLDHLAKPQIAAGKIEPWASLLKELGRRENVFCKVSGMVTEDDWIGRPAGFGDRRLQPYFDIAVEAFGPYRLIAGSDWPVCLLGTDYADWFGTLHRCFSAFSAAEQDAVFGANAVNAYRL